MTPLEEALRQISVDLLHAEVPFALVGGLAVSTRTEPRFTRDADIAVAAANDTEAEAVIRGLRSNGYQIGAIIEQDATGRLATVRLTRSPAPFDPVIDLLFASSGIEPEIIADAEALELLPDLRIGVASVGHLIALKILSRDDRHRPQDAVDLRALLRVASLADLSGARNALALITSRGYHRQRKLDAELDSLLHSPAG